MPDVARVHEEDLESASLEDLEDGNPVDPSVIEVSSIGTFNPPFGNGGFALGCIANSRITNMPAAYSISATAAYPSVDAFLADLDQTVSGPYSYGSHLVVTTDLGPGGASLLTYFDAGVQLDRPLAGTLSVWVCVEKGDH